MTFIPAGSLAFTWLDATNDEAPVVIYLSPSDLTVLGRRGHARDGFGGGGGDSIDDDTFATDRTEMWSACEAALLHSGFAVARRLRGNYVDRWFSPHNALAPTKCRIGSLFPDGSIHDYASFTLLDTLGFQTTIDEVAVGPGSSIGYYKTLGTGLRKDVYRYDLTNDVDLGIWVSEAIREITVASCILVLRDGTVLVGWSGVNVTTSVVKRYATNGTVLQTYVFPTATNHEPMGLVSGRDDTTFWVAFEGAAEYSTLVEVLVADGSFVNFHEVTNAQKAIVDATFGNAIDWQPDLGQFHVTRVDCGSLATPPLDWAVQGMTIGYQVLPGRLRNDPDDPVG